MNVSEENISLTSNYCNAKALNTTMNIFQT